jgi:hypothetical protein
MAWLPPEAAHHVLRLLTLGVESTGGFFSKTSIDFFPSENICFFQNEIMIKAIKAMTSDF